MLNKKPNEQRRAQLADSLGDVRTLRRIWEDMEAAIAAMIHDTGAPAWTRRRWGWSCRVPCGRSSRRARITRSLKSRWQTKLAAFGRQERTVCIDEEDLRRALHLPPRRRPSIKSLNDIGLYLLGFAFGFGAILYCWLLARLLGPEHMLKLLRLDGPPVSAGLEAAIRQPERIRREILPGALEAAKMFISKPVE